MLAVLKMQIKWQMQSILRGAVYGLHRQAWKIQDVFLRLGYRIHRTHRSIKDRVDYLRLNITIMVLRSKRITHMKCEFRWRVNCWCTKLRRTPSEARKLFGRLQNWMTPWRLERKLDSMYDQYSDVSYDLQCEQWKNDQLADKLTRALSDNRNLIDQITRLKMAKRAFVKLTLAPRSSIGKTKKAAI